MKWLSEIKLMKFCLKSKEIDILCNHKNQWNGLAMEYWNK